MVYGTALQWVSYGGHVLFIVGSGRFRLIIYYKNNHNYENDVTIIAFLLPYNNKLRSRNLKTDI
jgi:hypothetical protein